MLYIKLALVYRLYCWIKLSNHAERMRPKKKRQEKLAVILACHSGLAEIIYGNTTVNCCG